MFKFRRNKNERLVIYIESTIDLVAQDDLQRWRSAGQVPAMVDGVADATNAQSAGPS